LLLFTFFPYTTLFRSCFSLLSLYRNQFNRELCSKCDNCFKKACLSYILRLFPPVILIHAAPPYHPGRQPAVILPRQISGIFKTRSEEHTSELQSRFDL